MAGKVKGGKPGKGVDKIVLKSNTDFPFDDVMAEFKKQVEGGADCYQKFTCSGCGQRLTMEMANHFYDTGTCDKCPTVTDIRKQGCNFMMHMRLT